jgi:hypothetical protein
MRDNVLHEEPAMVGKKGRSGRKIKYDDMLHEYWRRTARERYWKKKSADSTQQKEESETDEHESDCVEGHR